MPLSSCLTLITHTIVSSFVTTNALFFLFSFSARSDRFDPRVVYNSPKPFISFYPSCSCFFLTFSVSFSLC